MDRNELLQQVTDWIEFFRDLGFDDFYRGPELEGLVRNWVPGPAITPAEPNVPSGHETALTPGDGEAAEASQATQMRLSSTKTPSVPAAVINPPQTSSASGREAAAGRPRRPPDAESSPKIAALPGTGLKSGIGRGTAPRSMNLFEAESPAAAPPARETLDEIRSDLGDCHRCKLASGRKHIVFGQGNPHAEVVFVGEGPGADEDEQGLPFVGRAGQLLNRTLQRVDIRRQDVYICNVVKCRPPGNRTPERDEVETCSPFLFRQLQAIRPRLICCLGIPAVRTVLGIKEGITRIHGRFYDYGACKAMATVHPAYVLRNPREERILVEDFQQIRDFLKSGS
jgi:uracil-DNA glycosylase